LILCIAGAILAVLTFFRVFLQKRREKIDAYNSFITTIKRRRHVLIAATVIFSIAGIVIFILTQDMSKLMVLLDRLTIVKAIIFMVVLFSYIFAFRRETGSAVKTANINARNTESQPA